MGIRRKAREMALQALYQSELTGDRILEMFSLLCENFEVNKKSIPYARSLIRGVSDHWDEINGLIERYASNWRIDRMSLVDRNILRLAIYEMFWQDDVPSSVVINEAIEVAKRFSTDDAGSFINGILDAINKSGVKEPCSP